MWTQHQTLIHNHTICFLGNNRLEIKHATPPMSFFAKTVVIASTTNQLGQLFPEEENESTINEFHFSLNPFSHTLSKTLKVSCRQQNFGITVGEDEQDELNELNNRAYVPDIGKNSSASESDQLHRRRHRLCLQLGLGFRFCQLTCLFLVFFYED